jgi:hypothetical protein
MNAEPTLDLAGEMGMGTAQYHENTGADIAPRDMRVVGTSPSIRSRANIGPAVEERSSLVTPGETELLVRSGNQNAPEVDARLPGPYNWRKEGLGAFDIRSLPWGLIFLGVAGVVIVGMVRSAR